MVKLKWDVIGKREYETGTNKGVLFPQLETGEYGTGVAWSGLVAVKQSPDGAEETPIYADNIKYLSLMSAENFKGSIEAFTYPEEFEACDGSKAIGTGVYAGQQNREQFGLVYSTIVGNDTLGNAYGEKMHFIYNARVSPSARDYETVNDTPNAITFSWDFNTTPVAVDDIDILDNPTAYIVADSTKMGAGKMDELKEMVYGTDAIEPKMPTIDEIITLFTEP